jgi:phosphopantetheinyl transferase (holo-ACP synthase)
LNSIGNDIVALALTDPERTSRQNFFSKIICREEVELFKSRISSKISFEHFVWLAWSVKESVHKFYSRNHSTLSFSPTKIIIKKIQLPVEQNISIDEELESTSFDKARCYCCEVSIEGRNYFTRSFINKDLIFSVCNDADDFGNICWGIKTITDDSYQNQSASVRIFALNKLKKVFNRIDLSIEKPNGYPVITQEQNIPLSFTHHGCFIGYAFALPQQIKNPA